MGFLQDKCLFNMFADMLRLFQLLREYLGLLSLYELWPARKLAIHPEGAYNPWVQYTSLFGFMLHNFIKS